MNLAQILAVLQLLIAFGVNQPVVDNVQGILMASVATTTQLTATVSTTTSAVQITIPPVDNSTTTPTFGATLPVMAQEATTSQATTSVAAAAPAIPADVPVPTCTLSYTQDTNVNIQWTSTDADTAWYQAMADVGDGKISPVRGGLLTPVDSGSWTIPDFVKGLKKRSVIAYFKNSQNQTTCTVNIPD